MELDKEIMEMNRSKIIPWYKLPLPLRALPFEKREVALAKWEKQFGSYDWKKG